MSKKRNINTILAQAGIKSDKATGALTTPLLLTQPVKPRILSFNRWATGKERGGLGVFLFQ